MNNVSFRVDVLVVGAGMSGMMAGLAASREGLSVMLVDTTFTPGGQATSTLVSEMTGFTHKGRTLYGGIQGELIEHLVRVGSARHEYDQPLAHRFASDKPEVTADRLCYNPEVLKILLDWFALNSPVKAMGGYRLQSVEEGEREVHAVLRGGLDVVEIVAASVIDATGCAEVTLRAGFETYRSAQESEVSTLFFRLSGIDLEAYAPFAVSEDLNAVIQEGYENGILPGKYLSIAALPGTRDVSVNATRAILDYESPRDITRGMIETRNQIIKIIPFMKEVVPGFHSAGLAAIGSVMGIRDGRRIVGLREIKEEDVFFGLRHKDSVALGCAPMGIHNPNRDEIDWKEAGVYSIPYSAMIPRKSRRIIAAGKCICSDKMASTSLRCIPAVMNTGEAAGYAATMAVQKKVAPADLDVAELRDFLASKGLNPG